MKASISAMIQVGIAFTAIINQPKLLASKSNHDDFNSGVFSQKFTDGRLAGGDFNDKEAIFADVTVMNSGSKQQGACRKTIILASG